ncbi:MAG: hypothetical protein K2M19_08695 [Muribaculaceae bacterium]|nr:hypothetical protein [Muribaculaceae bacterium]
MISDISISPEVRAAAPELKVLVAEAAVSNPPTSDALWAEITAECVRIAAELPMEAVNKQPAIAATRRAYKALGKEPNRYRPSAEALMRRCVKGVGLYRTSALVDLVNLMSLKTGVSIGGFDLDRIEGPTLVLGVGREGEPYEAIGRGQLNIAGLPVFRDAIGGIGTPTSDNDRTKLSSDTSNILLTINLYHGKDVELLKNLAERLLITYAGASEIRFRLVE